VVDVVYYGADATDKDNPAAVWNTYVAQTLNDGASFTQSRVSQTPNHVGPVCTEGTACAPGTRNLLDLFEVAINPSNGRAGIIYTADTKTQDGAGNPLPQSKIRLRQIQRFAPTPCSASIDGSGVGGFRDIAGPCAIVVWKRSSRQLLAQLQPFLAGLEIIACTGRAHHVALDNARRSLHCACRTRG
jgi:hypothetical protein